MKLEEYLKVDNKVNDYGGCYQTAIKDYLVANASPAIPKYLTNIIFNTIFIIIAKTPFIIGVLVSCNE